MITMMQNEIKDQKSMLQVSFNSPEKPSNTPLLSQNSSTPNSIQDPFLSMDLEHKNDQSDVSQPLTRNNKSNKEKCVAKTTKIMGAIECIGKTKENTSKASNIYI